MTDDFEIDHESVKQYFRAVHLLCFFGVLCFWFLPFIVIGLLNSFASPGLRPIILPKFSSFFCFGITVALGYSFLFVPWFSLMQCINLRYRLDGDTLRVDGGVFFLFRQSIPLERITDVALVQGPLLRHYGIWAMGIQTAGSQQCEATLYGVREPEKIRDLILSRRHQSDGT